VVSEKLKISQISEFNLTPISYSRFRCVFWDLYCAAPERRDTCEHSSEAKAFHDYGFVSSGYGVNGIAPHVRKHNCNLKTNKFS
jgi:hypothetical protein